MHATAHLRNIRISPRKVSIVLDLIRGKSTKLAMGILKHTPKAACEFLEKLLNSAVANAVNNQNMRHSDLYVSECFVCPGPTARRMQPVSKGRGHRILKRSSHVTLSVDEKRG
jgi:large subunit ribosomal protein L22